MSTTVFLVGGDVPTVSLQLLVLTGILLTALLLQTIFKPHNAPILFRLEVLGLLGCAAVVYCASYFFNTIGAFQNQFGASPG